MHFVTDADWLDGVFERAPLPAWAVGAGLVAAILGAVALAQALAGDPTRMEPSVLGDRDLRVGLTVTALAGYTPAARHYLLRAAARNLEALRRVLGPRASEAFAAPSPWPPASLAWVFLLALPAIGLAVDRDPGLYFRPSYWFVGNAWAWVLAPWCAWCLGRHVIATLGVSRQFSAVASALPEVDLLDRRWLAPFASQALTSALLWLLGPAIWAVNLVDDAFLPVVAVVTALCAAIGTAALLLTTRGARRRLADAKERELEAAHAALRGDSGSLARSVLAARPERPSVSDLVAWTGYVSELSTSPFTQASRLRFVLYLALPLGSWLGGALVDWGVGRFLG
jgi:hypothetical protein